MKKLKNIINILILMAIVALGVFVMKQMAANKKPLEHEQNEMAALPVKVMTLQKQFYTPSVLAYGNVEPSTVLQGKAELSGKVTYIHPQLRQGASIDAGTEVLRINPVDYKNALDQTNADLRAARTQLAQLQQEEQNTRNTLRIAIQNLSVIEENLQNVKRKEQPVRQNTGLIYNNIELAEKNYRLTEDNLNVARRALRLSEDELGRLETLVNQRLISVSQYDTQAQQVLQQEQQILQLEQNLVQHQQTIVQQRQQLTQQDQSMAQQDQNVLQQQQQIIQQEQVVAELQGQLRTFASRKDNALAQIERVEQQIKNQQTALRRTEIFMPFDARISSVSVEKGSFVGVGGVLFEAINKDGIEIKAELPLSQIQQLLSPTNTGTSFSSFNRSALDHLSLTANVRLVGGNPNAIWTGRVLRFAEALDPVKRTLSLIIAVDSPLIASETLPLLKGMYVQVDIKAPSIDTLVIPRTALHQGRVYVMNNDNRLEIRPVDMLFQTGEDVIVKGGIQAGERLIINDLIPVIPNMPLLDVAQQKRQPLPQEQDKPETQPSQGELGELSENGATL